MANQNTAFHLLANTGPCYCGPGDRYTFLVTGAQTNGAYFIMEAMIPPEADRRCTFTTARKKASTCSRAPFRSGLAKKRSTRRPETSCKSRAERSTHFVTPEARQPGCFFFSPAGMDSYFEEVLEPVQNRSVPIPPVTDALIARMVGAGPRHRIEYVGGRK